MPNLLSKLPVPWRKTLLVLAAVSVFAYAVAVLAYVPTIPDIGLRCGFRPVLKRVDLPEVPNCPSPDDTLLEVGAFEFSDQAQFWAQVRLVRRLIALEHAPVTAANGLRLGEHGQKEVRVKYLRRQGDLDQEGEAKEIWVPLGRLPLADLIPSILWFLVKLGLFIIGALVFWKRPADPSAAQFFLLCIVNLGAYMGGYHWTRIAVQPTLLLPFMVCAVLLPAVSLHFYLLFPRPKGFLRRHPHWVSAAIYGVPLGFLAILVGSYFRLRALRDGSASETAEAWNWFGTVVTTYMRLASLWYLASVVCLVHSFRTAGDATERNQVKWILIGSLAALVPIAYSLYLVSWDQDDFGAGAATWPMFAASVCFTAAFAVSITRYRLMQLDQILTSGMIYFLLSFLAGVVYYAVVFVGMLATGVIRAPSFSEALFFAATALVFLLALDLARSRFKKILDRRFDREKHHLDRTLRRMGDAVGQLVDPPTLARRLLGASAELLNVTGGAVYLSEGQPPIYRVAGHLGPTPPTLSELTAGCPVVEALQSLRVLRVEGAGWRVKGGGIYFPPTTQHSPSTTNTADPAQRQLQLLGGVVGYALNHEGRLLGFLVLGPKKVGGFGPEDFQVLAAFAQLTALALENARGHSTIEQLNGELRTKVEKISEQQRRILALQNQLMNRGGRAGEQPSNDANGSDGAPAAPAPETHSTGLGLSGAIIGSSLAMRRVWDMVRKTAASPSAVLICGESGTGKELLARALHENSPRAGKPYVKVHCAALSPNLLESELFGHVKGAFTGAHRDKVGRFELAHGGTLFLDEIGDINLEVQTKLLRVLQEKTFERVGSSEPVSADVRVIAATHQDLEKLMRQGRFREDLYFRLKVIPITVPPLRERPEDVPELALHFLGLYSKRCGRAVTGIDDDVMALLKSYAWPGNVRELENVIERAVVVAEGSAITLAELPPDLLRAVEEPERTASPSWGATQSVEFVPASGADWKDEVAQRERERLVRALAGAGGNKAEAARALGMARSTLISRLKKYGLS